MYPENLKELGSDCKGSDSADALHSLPGAPDDESQIPEERRLTMRRIVVVSFAALLATTLVALTVISIITIPRAERDDDGNRRDDREGGRAGKLTAAYSWITALTAALGISAWHALRNGSDNAPLERYRVSALGGATAVFANTLLICGVYFLDLVREMQFVEGTHMKIVGRRISPDALRYSKLLISSYPLLPRCFPDPKNKATGRRGPAGSLPRG